MRRSLVLATILIVVVAVVAVYHTHRANTATRQAATVDSELTRLSAPAPRRTPTSLRPDK